MLRLLNAFAIAVTISLLCVVPTPAYDDGVPPVWRGALRPDPVERVELTRIEAAIEEYRLASAWAARSATVQGSVHWVSPTGAAATWGDCASPTPLSGAAACSMTRANSDAVAGDTINIRVGTYNTRIAPARSGTLADRITYQGYSNETATITSVGNFGGIDFDNRDYIRVLNLTFDSLYYLAYLRLGSSYNEIAFNRFQIGTGPANAGFNIFSLTSNPADANTHNWIHNNVLTKGGMINLTPTGTAGCDDSGGLFNLGNDNADWFSDYNTIEDNQFSYGAHHALKTDTRHNVIRNNFVHNEGAYFVATTTCTEALNALGKMGYCSPDGYYGNRGITALMNHTKIPGAQSDTFNLIERNRISSAGLPSDGNGADGLTLGGERDIARFNTSYNSQELGIYFRGSSNIADNIRAYFNTVYANGQGPQCRVDNSNGFWKGGVRFIGGATGSDNNVFIYNLLYGNYNANQSGGSGPGTAGYGRELNNNGTGNTVVPNWVTSSGYGQSHFGYPLFEDPSLTDMTSTSVPDLSLRAGSGAIDAAGALTTMSGAGASTTSGTFADPLYFQYGERGSDLVRANGTMYADRVQINGVVARIVSINYTTGAVTFDQALTWPDGASVYLYSDSSDTQVLHGAAPDFGAYEFGAADDPTSGGRIGRRLRRPE